MLIGALILLFLLVIGVILIVQFFSSHGHNAGVLVGQAAKPKGLDSLVTQIYHSIDRKKLPEQICFALE